MNSSPVEVVLFDLGNVILPFNNFQIAEKLARFSQANEFRDPQKIFSYIFDFQEGAINPFDAGKLSPEDFFQSLRKTLRLPISFEQFIPIWTDIFTENQEVSRIILSLKGRKRLGLLSNTDSLHFNYILSTFPIVKIFEKYILSYEVGFTKPDVRIFQEALKWASVEPRQVLFIDDTKGHVEAAASLGMQDIRFISADQLRKELSMKLNFINKG